MKTFTTHRLVKSEDLNHHGTLYAGQGASWFVESGFVAAANMTRPENIVCRQIHGMTFSRPVHLGELVTYESKIVYTGRTSLIAYVRMHAGETQILEGFITFVNVDENAKPLPHGQTVSAATPAEVELQERASALAAATKNTHAQGT